MPLINFEKIIITPKLIEIYSKVFPDALDTLLEFDDIIHQMNGSFGNKAEWYGILIENQLIGFGTIGRTPQISFIYNVGIDPIYQSSGYGKLLISYLIETCHQNVYLFVEKTNRIAINLYRKFYFEFTDQAYVPPIGQICLVRYHKPRLLENDIVYHSQPLIRSKNVN